MHSSVESGSRRRTHSTFGVSQLCNARDLDSNFCNIEPASATVLGKVANCDLNDFKKAIESAYDAQPKFFESTTGTARGALLRKWHDLILANQEDSK